MCCRPCYLLSLFSVTGMGIICTKFISLPLNVHILAIALKLEVCFRSLVTDQVISDFMILLFLFGLYFWINAFYIYFEYFRSIRILIRDSVLNVCLCSQLIIGTLFRRVLSMYILNEFNWIETNTVDDFSFWKRVAMFFTKGWTGMSLVSFMTNWGVCLPINQLNVGHHEMQFWGDWVIDYWLINDLNFSISWFFNYHGILRLASATFSFSSSSILSSFSSSLKFLCKFEQLGIPEMQWLLSLYKQDCYVFYWGRRLSLNP